MKIEHILDSFSQKSLIREKPLDPCSIHFLLIIKAKSNNRPEKPFFHKKCILFYEKKYNNIKNLSAGIVRLYDFLISRESVIPVITWTF